MYNNLTFQVHHVHQLDDTRKLDEAHMKTMAVASRGPIAFFHALVSWTVTSDQTLINGIDVYAAVICKL